MGPRQRNIRVSFFSPKTRTDAEYDTLYFKNGRKSKTNNKQERIISAVNADPEGRRGHIATYYSAELRLVLQARS